jgi:phosphomannomutase
LISDIIAPLNKSLVTVGIIFMVYKIKFGTDGWRGKIAQEYTFENLKRISQGFANFLLEMGHNGKWVIVGHDKRFLGEDFAATVANVLGANGFNVFLTDGPTPTPVISYAVVDKKAVGAINITASHNPPADNGFKVRDKNGGAIPPVDLEKIEKLIPDNLSDVKFAEMSELIESGVVKKFDASVNYIKHIENLIDLQPIKDAGIKIAVDAMWGNGAGWFPKLLAGGKTEVIEVNNHRNPSFPNMQRPEPIPPNVDFGLKFSKDNNSDVLVILDGDADRVGIGDENGVFINQLQVYGLLAYYFLEVKGQRGPIVKTLSTTTMLNKLGKIYNVPVYETGVGFKYVAPKMIETNAMIGGEESGGYAFKGNVPERDGILGGLFFLDLMVQLDKKPSELIEILFEKVGYHFYDRIDTIFTGDRDVIKKKIAGLKVDEIAGLEVVDILTNDGFQYKLSDGGWLLIRFSGTEPKIRVYCETTHQDKVKLLLQAGLKFAGL